VQLQDAGGIVALQLHEGVPYAAYTWYDPASVKLGSEISFPKYFYKPMRTRDEIRADIVAMEKETERLLGKILIDAEDMI
jgi:type I restriction enzyme M protein